MIKDDIICMGHEADAYASCEWSPVEHPQYWKQYRDEHFAHLVAATEREAIIEINAMHGGSIEIEAAIRQRSQS